MKTKAKTYRTTIGSRGQVKIPPGLVAWRLGVRVYFRVRDGALVLSAKPSGVQNGRLLSVRVRLCRIKPRGGRAATFARESGRNRLSRHGEAKKWNELATEARCAAERACIAVEDSIHAVESGMRRIAVEERCEECRRQIDAALRAGDDRAVAEALSAVAEAFGGVEALVQSCAYRVSWSPEDGEFLGRCEQFPSMSWLSDDQEAAKAGIESAVREVLIDLMDPGQVDGATPGA